MIYQWCTEGWYPWEPETEDYRLLLHSAVAMDCFFGGLCNNDQKGVVRPEGGHHVNYSLKEGGGGGRIVSQKACVSL